MVTASFVINITLGVMNVFVAGDSKHSPVERFISLLAGSCLVTFGIMGLVHG